MTNNQHELLKRLLPDRVLCFNDYVTGSLQNFHIESDGEKVNGSVAASLLAHDWLIIEQEGGFSYIAYLSPMGRELLLSEN